MHTAVKHFQQQVQRVNANPRVPTRQGVGTDEHNGTRGRNVKRLPDPNRMTAENVTLEQFYLLWRNNAILESAKARGNAIGHCTLSQTPSHSIVTACNR